MCGILKKSTKIKLYLILYFICLVLISSCSLFQKKSHEDERPNIIFFFADQLRNQSLSYNGETNISTPNIDMLAGEGVTFTNAVSTCPICGPYRGMLQTGRYPTNTGLLINWVDPDTSQTSLAEIFSSNGYKTGFIGKWHLCAGYLKKYGIEYDESSTIHGEKMKGFNDPNNHSEFVPPGSYRMGYDFWAAYNFHTNFAENCYYYRDTPEKKYFEPYETNGQVDVAIDFMEKSKDDNRPFMLMIAPHVPHNPWKPEDVPGECLEQVNKELVVRKNVEGPLVPEEHLEDWDPRVYYAMIKNIDNNIGRLMKYLRDSGLEKNTIVVFTSDHGEMLGSHGKNYKMVPYAESVDVPLIFYWKDHFEAGTKSNSIYTPIDYMPTLLSLADIEVPAFADGMDLSHIPEGRDGKDREEALMMLYSSHWDYCLTGKPWKEWRAVKTKQFTYIKWIDGDEELYNNVQDPYQMNNLATYDEARTDLIMLRKKLENLLENANDEFLPGTEYEKWYNDRRQVVFHHWDLVEF
jgi:arylsulfatase A-like enzyme